MLIMLSADRFDNIPGGLRPSNSAVTGDEPQAAEARERAAQAIARAQNISVEETR
jgi:hypothetical protein